VADLLRLEVIALLPVNDTDPVALVLQTTSKMGSDESTTTGNKDALSRHSAVVATVNRATKTTKKNETKKRCRKSGEFTNNAREIWA
jgi:hypothetical protein